MKILGKEVEASAVLERIEERLRAVGIDLSSWNDDDVPLPPPVEPRVDPVAHHLEGLEKNSDPTQGLPLQTHRTGAGRAVLMAKWLFRKTCQPLINEALGRQRLFNAHARDAYAELAARVERLSADLDQHQRTKPAAKKKKAATPRATRSTRAG